MSVAIKAGRGMGPKIIGTALVATDGFSARYDLDRKQGIFSRPNHSLYGQSYVGRVLVLDLAKGGVASAWMFNEMVTQKMAPLALVMNWCNPVLAQGAAFAGLTLVDAFAEDITSRIETGDEIEIDPAKRSLIILNRD